MGGNLRLAALPVCLTLAFGQSVSVPLRTRVEPFRGSGEWAAVTVVHELKPQRTALILCDMWDKHWCSGATQRVNVLAERMGPLLKLARSRGILVIHAPSETMDFYKDAPQRAAILNLQRVATPAALDLSAPPLPIDDSKGGCDTPDSFYKAWTREHPAIAIAPNDLISDKGDEIYSALKLRGIDTLLVMGVHANMCILNRSFAIKQMTKWGIHCILVRDMTDAMYNPADRPFVSHEKGTELVIEHIEKYWTPTLLSGDLMKALGTH